MAGVGTFNNISHYIPRLTRYRYSMANLHRSQFGRGAQVPQQPTTRIRVDLRQLDHFLGFITSPHLVQDLPFGQKHLKLSSGEVIQVPNVIRMMIPERVVQQYTQYCLKINFRPFSGTTMRRVLFECMCLCKKFTAGLRLFCSWRCSRIWWSRGPRTPNRGIRFRQGVGDYSCASSYDKQAVFEGGL